MVHRRLVYIYLLNVPSFSSRYLNKIKQTSRLGRLLAFSLEILSSFTNLMKIPLSKVSFNNQNTFLISRSYFSGCRMSIVPFRSVGSGWQWNSEGLNYVRFLFKFVNWKIWPRSHLHGFHVFPRDNICKAFTFIHNPVFDHSNTVLFALLACIIMHINGKQFRCSVFTFVQDITTDLKRYRII